jgi:hypothetical protein
MPMKPSTCLILTLVLGAGLYSTAALAQDPAAAAAAQSGPAPDAALAAAQTSKPHRRAHHVRTRHHAGNRYNQCLKEKLAVAQHYCDSHADACEAEKDGAARQCQSEARGEKQTG